MKNAALKGKPYAGNPHVRFDEGGVASEKPRRGSLLYNVSRRNFVNGVVASFGMAALGACKGLAPFRRKPRIAAQLYSIHKIFWTRPAWCLEGLREAGYEGVEFAGFNKHGPQEIAEYLRDADMAGMGAHVNGFVELTGDALYHTLDFCAAAGLETVTTPHAKCDTADAYRRFGHDMGRAAEAAARYGIKVGIHSTYHHFTTKYAGVTAWDVMFSEASPLLQQQVDTSNAFHVLGGELLPLLKKYRGRHYSVHLKENTPSKTATLGEPPTDGAPPVPWKDVMECLSSEDVAWHVVEAEAIPDSLRPLADSMKFLKVISGN